MILPFAIYFAAKARTRMARGWWVAGMLVIAAAAAATISRTTVIMAVVMAIAALAVRRQAVVKLLPLLLVLPIFVHAAAPGAIGGLLSSFGSQEGTDLIGSLNSRAGESGSGRLADLDPAIDLWLQSPIVGLGLDNPNIATSVPQDLPAAVPVVPLIFDNQYLLSLVTFGLVGLIAFLWFIWGTARRLLKYAKRAVGDEADYIAACGIACAGYGAGMFFYDALAFVQVTLLLFIFAALGLKTLSLRAEQPAPASP
jgi:polysaccharide biosynthesis protein PslJ